MQPTTTITTGVPIHTSIATTTTTTHSILTSTVIHMHWYHIVTTTMPTIIIFTRINWAESQPSPLKVNATQVYNPILSDLIKCGLFLRNVVTFVQRELEFYIQALQTFNPMELRNGIVFARGLSVAKLLGYRTVMTGDGADELFAGYSFLHNMSAEHLQAYSDKMTKIMRFSGVQLAKALELQLKWQDRLSGRQLHGKFILREAFGVEAFTAWRKKEPIEVGSGTTVLPKMFQESMSAADLKKEQDRII
ncbi:hypothetical protein BGZ67_007632 [Mortierella alpina]|nr:hypothetical protein BGZ67_007632 [Mortierella alpina]